MVSSIKDDVIDAVLKVVKSDILGHLDEVAKANNEVKDEVKRAVENLSGDIEHLEGIVNNKIEVAEKHRTNQ